MALISQTRTANILTEAPIGQDWTNEQNTRVLNNIFAETTFNGSGTTRILTWSDFGFSFSPFDEFSGLELVHGVVKSNTLSVANESFSSFTDEGTILSSIGLNIPTSITGGRIDTTVGGPTSFGTIVNQAGYTTMASLNSIRITNTVNVFVFSGSVIYRHYGLELTLYANSPDMLIGRDSGEGVRLGNARISTFAEDSLRYLGVICSDQFSTKSDLSLVLGGQPITMYEDSSGNAAIAVYDASAALGGGWSVANSSYVYDGIRYSFLENSDHRLFRGNLTDSDETPSDTTVWRGVPVSLSASGFLMGRKIAGNIDETRKFALGGVPLTAVRVGDDWAIAMADT